MPYRVQFSNKEIEIVWEWAGRSAKEQITWGDDNPEARTLGQITSDCFQGKLGEWAWDKYCYLMHNMAPMISWEVILKGGDDGCDFKYPAAGLEVKTNKNVQDSYYLMVPTQRIDMADVYLMASVGWWVGNDTNGPKGWADLLGFISRKKLKQGIILKKGDPLPPYNTVPMQQNNYAAQVSDLHNHFPDLVDYVTREPKKL